MAKELENCFKQRRKIRQRPDFRDAKHTYRRPYKEHVESILQGNQSIHPAQQRRQKF